MPARWTRALVTGASSGIGRVVATEAVVDGSRLVPMWAQRRLAGAVRSRR